MSITMTKERLPNPFLTQVPSAARLLARDEVRTQIMQAGGADVSTRAAI